VIVGIGCWLGYLAATAAGMGPPHTTRAAAIATPRPTATASRGLTLASIFAARSPSLAGYNRHKLRTLIATGDVIPARTVNYKMVTTGDFQYPFRPTAPYLRTGDITLINLESPLLASGCPVTDVGMSFCGDARAVRGLTLAGVDVACTANNHIGNYGNQGILETWQHLQDAGIKPCGYDRVAYVNVRGLRFAFLAYNTIGARFDYATARKQIREARKHADVVVAEVHWGMEYTAMPTVAPGIADDDPVKVGRYLIDSGADLVIGNHPHHVQGVELYHGHLITYAHGNFVFDQMFNRADCPGNYNFVCSTEEGVVGTYTFYGKKLVSVRYRPVVIYNWWQPRWATPSQSRVIMAEMRAATYELKKEHR
jgi:poly-gamma-glutamate synthesis protein (capsule biosynthesis protein)